MTAPIVIKPEDTQPAPKPRHFEQVWEEGEALFAPNIADSKRPAIIAEMQAKLAVYRAVSEKDAPPEEKSKALTSLCGNILLSLTHLTLKDNINSFAALSDAIAEKKLMQMETQFQQEAAANNGSNPRVDEIFAEMKEKLASSGMMGIFESLGETLKKTKPNVG